MVQEIDSLTIQISPIKVSIVIRGKGVIADSVTQTLNLKILTITLNSLPISQDNNRTVIIIIRTVIIVVKGIVRIQNQIKTRYMIMKEIILIGVLYALDALSMAIISGNVLLVEWITAGNI